MIELENLTTLDIDINLLEKIAISQTSKNIELIFCDDKYIQNLNKTYRNINKPTDVLSFPLSNIPHVPLGNITINVNAAKNMSEKLNHSFEDEIALLFIHGLLHLLGFDHENDEGQMREKEEKLIKEFNLPKSLIVRTCE